MTAKSLLYTLIAGLIILTACNPESKPPQSSNSDSAANEGTTGTADTMVTVPEPTPKSFEEEFAVHNLFQNEISDVVNAIGSEDYALALKKIDHYRGKLTLSPSQEAYFRFMHIYATAGLVVEKKKSKADLGKIIGSYKDQNIITHHYEITPGDGMPFNQVQVKQDIPGAISLSLANSDGFNILCFVRAKMKNSPDLQARLGKRAYLCGTLRDFKLSDGDINSWICDLNLDHGFIKVLEDEFEKD